MMRGIIRRMPLDVKSRVVFIGGGLLVGIFPSILGISTNMFYLFGGLALLAGFSSTWSA